MSSAIPAPPKKILPARNENDDSENEDVDIGLQEDIDQSDEDDDSTSKHSSDNDEPGSETDDDASSSAIDEENEGGENSGGEDEDVGGGGEGSDDEGAAVIAEKQKNKKKRSATKKDTEDDLTLLGVPHGIHFDDDDDDDSDDDADKDTTGYFQKLTTTVSESYIESYHPESLSHNYDEIQTLSRVVRNSSGFIVDELHRTIPIMTKYEKTRILGQRAKQLNEGAPAFIKIDSTVIDGYLIAVKELEQKKTPFIIRRPLPNGGSEYWRIQDLEIL